MNGTGCKHTQGVQCPVAEERVPSAKRVKQRGCSVSLESGCLGVLQVAGRGEDRYGVLCDSPRTKRSPGVRQKEASWSLSFTLFLSLSFLVLPAIDTTPLTRTILSEIIITIIMYRLIWRMIYNSHALLFALLWGT